MYEGGGLRDLLIDHAQLRFAHLVDRLYYFVLAQVLVAHHLRTKTRQYSILVNLQFYVSTRCKVRIRRRDLWSSERTSVVGESAPAHHAQGSKTIRLN